MVIPKTRKHTETETEAELGAIPLLIFQMLQD